MMVACGQMVEVAVGFASHPLASIIFITTCPTVEMKEIEGSKRR
jgi:hypothetical protein